MKFLSTTQWQTLTIVDLPRNCYHMSFAPNPKKIAIIATMSGVILTAIVFGLFG